jgi:predicted lipoprotein with Yx(FWY)xxD motif
VVAALVATVLVTAVTIALAVLGLTRHPPHRATAATTTARNGVAGAAYAAEATAAPAGISTRTVSGLGTVLVDASGRTLYAFLPDAHAKVECLSVCTTFWAPLKLAPGQNVALATRGVKRLLVGSVPAPGGRVATYAGWPLYTYTNDARPGLANGQGAFLPEPCTFLQLDCSLNLAGPVSYVLAPSGAVVRKHPGATALGQ